MRNLPNTSAFNSTTDLFDPIPVPITLIDFEEENLELKRMEGLLRVSEERYRRLFEEFRDAIYITTREGTFVDINAAVLELLGYTRDEMIGTNAQALYVQPGDRLRFEQEIEQHGSVRDYAVKLRKKDGTELDCLVTGTVREADDGGILGYQGIIRDITAQKQLEARFLQAQKMEGIGRLAAGIAHDFNNLLTVIIGSTSIAMKDLPTDHPIRDELQAIKRSSDRAARLNSQLMAFARQQSPDLQILNLNDLLLDFGKMLRRLIGEDIEVVVLTDPNLGLARADSVQIEQVLVNLAVNARDAMPTGGRLVLRTANVTLDGESADRGVGISPGSYVTLAVADTGEGMTEEVKAHCLAPFFTTKQMGEGTGLGLATCYGIVRQHGGYFEVESEVARGTTIRVYLPRVVEEAADMPVQHEVSGPVPRGTETVLLVEDDAMLRKCAVRMLRRQGYTVLEAANGEEALRIARAKAGQPIHLLLTDVVMPGMRGHELAERLRTARPGLKVLLMSGYPGEIMRRRGESCPDTALLEKPFTSDVLVGRVREALDQREAQSKGRGSCREVISTILVA